MTYLSEAYSNGKWDFTEAVLGFVKDTIAGIVLTRDKEGSSLLSVAVRFVLSFLFPVPSVPWSFLVFRTVR